MEGRLKPGDALPSFRQLAADHRVSVITVKRAYEELERAEIIFRKQGLGTFVAEGGSDRTRQLKLGRAEELIHQAIHEAKEAGLDENQIQELIDRVRQGAIKGGEA